MCTYLFIYSFSVKEEDDHMVVEIKKADGYMVSIVMYPVYFNGFHYVRQLYLFFFSLQLRKDIEVGQTTNTNSEGNLNNKS